MPLPALRLTRALTRALTAAAGLLLLPAAHADIIHADYSINTFGINVFNDRIGNSRFFANPNTDSIRVSAIVSPSPDSDVLPAACGSNTCYSTNGALTTVTVGHDSFGSFTQQLRFVGVTSGGGGGRNEFTTVFDRAHPGIASRLGALDATPFNITINNPNAPNGPTLSFSGPDYDPNALPAFLRNVAVTGGGLTPTITWTVPDDGSVAPTHIRLQVRIVDGESADRSRITSARLVHNVDLPVTATSYTFGDIFSNAGLPGFPPGLQEGQRYEIAVVLDQRAGNGQVLGRARTFFEFTPLPNGTGNVAVYLPSVGPNGQFKFDVEVTEGQTIYIDPVVAVGYEYQIGNGDPHFASVTLPDVGDGLYQLFLFDGSDWVFEAMLSAGNEYVFAPGGVDRFRVLGIETSAELDPADNTAFITALTFAGSGRFTGTMTAITAEIPEPPAAALALLALAMLASVRRRR